MESLIKKGFLEKFKDVIVPIIPNKFLDCELTPEILDKAVEYLTDDTLSEAIKLAEKSKLHKHSEKVRNLISWLKWLEKSYMKQMQAAQDIYTSLEDGTILTKDQLYQLEYEKGTNSDQLKSDLREDNILSNLIEFLWDFNDSGNKMFRIEEQLTHELYNTEIKSVDESFLKLPYQCIGFYLPYNNKITVKDVLIDYVYISEFEENEGRLIKILLVRKDEAVLAFNWIIKEGDILKQIKSQLTEKYQTKKAYKDMNDIIQFVVACLLYINSTNSQQTIIPRIPKTKLNEGKVSEYPVCSLGAGLKIDKRLHYVGNLESETDEEKETSDIHVLKWTVRGHFRNQSYGSGVMGKYNKLIWIQPFIKGRERENNETPVKTNSYNVE